MATKSELEEQVSRLAQQVSGLERDKSELLFKLNNIDASRPGPTEEDLRGQREALAAKDEEIDRLQKAFDGQSRQLSAAKKELEAALNGLPADEELAELAPIRGMVGKLPDGRVLQTVGVEIGGGGVMLFTTVNDELAVSYVQEIKLAKKAGSVVAEKRPEFR